MNINKIPQMETIKETAKLFNLAEYFVRQKVLNGEIVAVKAGRKFLVNVDKFAEYLNNSTIHQENVETENCIKPIPEKL